MENTEIQNTQCEMKTDLSLLLECLKYQMDSPASQKEALVTIQTICQQSSDVSDYFREIGGLMFVNDLAKSSVHCIVKEAALFTLAVVIESNVYCQQSLCTSELFEELIFFLTNKDSSMTLKRISVYVMLVLVSNNKSGQTYIRETGCIGVLLQLFRTTLSISEMNLSDENINQCYQLWSSVCSTLCACVNNPQNEDNQNTCCSVFPHAKDWLQSCIKPEIIRPICSFVGLTVANNSYVQEYFVSVGGLDVLAEVLIKLVHDSSRSCSSAKLAVVVTKTLDACIADNPSICDVLLKYHIVSKLLRLLTCGTLDSGEKISIILTIGHCTEDCEENQYDLLTNNGLPVMIHLLTESQDEEVNKAATFVLRNCKEITAKLSLEKNEYSLNLNDTEQLKMDLHVRERNLEDYWKKAKEILHRIELLEKECDEETGRRQRLMPQEAVMYMTSKYRKMNPSNKTPNIERTHTQVQSSQLSIKAGGLIGTTSANNQSTKNGTLKTVKQVNASTRESDQNVVLHLADKLRTGSVQKGHATNERPTCEKKQSIPQASEHLFKQPSLTVKKVKQAQVAEPVTFCSCSTNRETSITTTSASPKMTDLRCSGCVTIGLSFNSRNFNSLLHACPHQCDRHKVILEAEERYKRGLRKSVICDDSSSAAFKKILLIPAKKGRLNMGFSTFRSRHSSQENFQSIRLTPLKKTQSSISNENNFQEKYNLMPTCTKNQDAHLKKQTVQERHKIGYHGSTEEEKYSSDEDDRSGNNEDL